MPEQPTDYRVAVFGSGGVGKTSLVLRFVRGTFRDTYVPTIEDTYRQVISCNRQVCTLQITDTTGSHQFPAMQRLSITKAHAFILVYSITNKASFEELQSLYLELAGIKMDELPRVPIMLVGNKSDESDSREVSTVQGKALAQKWKCGFMETSAKTNTNVKEVFQELLKMETRRNMTLVGENKRRSRFSSLFRRRQVSSTEFTSENSAGLDTLDMPKQMQTSPGSTATGTSKDKTGSKLKKLWRHKSVSGISQSGDLNGVSLEPS